ncbi:LOW QUALITY PROTEIN: uncharacterized protein Dwil_GK27325, partial [Drosophila willistoni]
MIVYKEVFLSITDGLILPTNVLPCKVLLGFSFFFCQLPGCKAAATTNWTVKIELALEYQPDKLAYCRSLQKLQQQHHRRSLRNTNCAQLLQNDLSVSGELLFDTQPRCCLGQELYGGHCRKRV